MDNRFDGSNTILFIPKSQLPQDMKAIYEIIVCDIKPHKSETDRTKLIDGGNLIYYPGKVTNNKSDITTSKTLINSTISTSDARCLCEDIANFDINKPMDR